MSLQPFVPLAFAIALVVPVLLAYRVATIDRILTRLSLFAFGGYVDRVGRKRGERQRRLRAAHVPTTYRGYAARTLLYSALFSVVGGLLGLYLVWGALRILAIDPATARAVLPVALQPLAEFAGLETLTPLELVTSMTVSSLTIGLVAGLLTYWARWWWPEHVAATRKRSIDATMPQTIAFVYALSRSGMEFPKIMRILADHRRIYGATAAEVAVAVRHMDLFGRDMITAIQTTGRRTPSEGFKEFSENLSSVLQSGRSISSFLESQYEDFQEEAEAQQENLLNLLSTLAEGYVTLFVAGPLFLITILVIIGIAGAETMTTLQVFVYFVLPVGNIAFILYLDTVTQRFGTEQRLDELPSLSSGLGDVRRASKGESARADGGIDARGVGSAGASGPEADRRTANLERVALHRRIDWLRTRLGRPVQTLVEQPLSILYVTVPIAAFGTVFRLASAGELSVHVVDDLLVQATLFVVSTFAVVYEIHRRRIDAVEAAVPDFLDRLASVNEAGMSVVASIGRVRGSDLGALDAEVDRVWGDIQWGADIETALGRFERRIRTRTVSRAVALITNAMNASGDISRVLRIAAAQAKADRRLKEHRRQEMLSYVLVVYISFGVFLVIIAALNSVLIPNLPETTPADAGGAPVPGGGGELGGLGTIDASAYTLVFFHTALIQALLSGIVAGQMSAGDVRAGAKHASILMAIAYGAFLVM